MVFALFAVQLAFMKKIGAGDVQCISYGVICCNSEKVQPPSLPDFPPSSFQQLYTSTEPCSLFFYNHIRKLNASFCMALMNVQDVSLSAGIIPDLWPTLLEYWANLEQQYRATLMYTNVLLKHEEQVSL